MGFTVYDANSDGSFPADKDLTLQVPLFRDPVTKELLVKSSGGGGSTPDVQTIGSLTAGSPTLEISTSEIYNTAIEVLGTWTGVVSFEYTPDATSPVWYPLTVQTQGASQGQQSSTSVNGVFFAVTGGMQKIRVNFIIPTSGTVTVTANASIAQQSLSVTNLSENIWTCSFANTNASALSCDQFRQIYKSSGFNISQASGNLSVVASTTLDEEWLAVSTRSWTGAMLARYKTILSQRIVNNNFVVMLADKLGEGLTLTVNSTTSITVSNVPGTWSAENIGQFMHIGAVGGLTLAVPGRYAIASVSGSNLTFTVVGWPATGTTTCTLFGWNYHRALYDSTTATSVKFDSQRKGWATGDTTATINTTASPGHTAAFDVRGREVAYHDSLVASALVPKFITRASRYENMPDQEVPLFLFLWSYNGTTNPLTATTWTVGFVSVESYPKNPVFLAGSNQIGALAPIAVVGGDANNNLDINLARIGATAAVTGGVAGILAVGGNIAHGTAATANPNLIGGVDSSTLTRRMLTDPLGQQSTIGAGEVVMGFSLTTGAAGAPTDGTQAKTFHVPARESDFLIGITTINTTALTFQVEYSYNNTDWYVMALQRIDLAATASQYGAATTNITQVLGSIWRGKTYGAPFLRLHNTGATAAGTFVGIMRVIPQPVVDAATVAPFRFDAANTTESGSAASTGGTLATGGVKTLKVPVVGSCKVQLVIDASTCSASNNIIQVEGSFDAGFGNPTLLTLQPVGGGATSTTVTYTNTTTNPGVGVFEADLGSFAFVRARLITLGTSGIVWGALRIVPIAARTVALTTASAQTFYTSTVSAMMLAANPLRTLAVIKNNGAGTLYFTPGSGTVTSTSGADSLASGDVAYIAGLKHQINGIFGAAGTAVVTEIS